MRNYLHLLYVPDFVIEIKSPYPVIRFADIYYTKTNKFEVDTMKMKVYTRKNYEIWLSH